LNAAGNTLARVLLIEDDAMLLQAMEDYLNHVGFQITACHYTGPSALDIAGLPALMDAPPEIIISDYRLPGTPSGLDLIGQIRDVFGAEIPAIMFTGDVTREAAANVAAVASVKLLIKPVRMSVLVEEIEAVVAG